MEGGSDAQCGCNACSHNNASIEGKPIVTQTASDHVNCTDPKIKEDCENMCTALVGIIFIVLVV